MSVFDRAGKAKRDLDPLLVVPTHVGINYLDELLNGRSLPVPRVERFRFQPSEEVFTCGVVGRAPLVGPYADELRFSDTRHPAWPEIVGAAI